MNFNEYIHMKNGCHNQNLQKSECLSIVMTYIPDFFNTKNLQSIDITYPSNPSGNSAL